jgi:hypothetical protein
VTLSSQLRTRAWHRCVPGDPAPHAGSLSSVTTPHAFRTRAWHRYVREEPVLAEARELVRGVGRGSFGTGTGDAGGGQCRWLFSVRSRAHSSAGERPLHTREVPGSIPGAPMTLEAALRAAPHARSVAPFYFRHLISNDPINNTFAESVCDSALKAAGARSQKRKPQDKKE